MRKRLAAFSLLLASCGPAPADNPFAGSDSGAGNTAAIVRGVDYGNRHSAGLALQPPAGRGLMLAQAVRSTNRRCSEVTRAEFKGALEHRAFWAVACGSAEYLLVISADGSIGAETCRVQRDIGAGCWEKW